MSRKKPLTVAPGSISRLFTEDEALQWTGAWLSTFAKNQSWVKNEQFLWHLFSGGRYPSTDGDAAISAYRSQIGTEFVVLSNDRRIAFLTDQLPESCSLFDYYVFPPNLAWTMAFTHESGWLGPYFARHPNPAELDRANEAAARKVREAQLAREKGWA